MYENIKNFTRNNKSNIIISSIFILSVYLIKLGTLATSIDNEFQYQVVYILLGYLWGELH